MKIIFKTFLVLICLIFSNCNKTEKISKSFTLQGKINGQDSGKIVFYYGFGTAYHCDTANVINGKFSFKGSIEEPTRGYIEKEGDRLNRNIIYLEPGIMSITLNNDNFKNFNFVGSISQQELDKLNEVLESSHNPDSVLLNFVVKNPDSYLTPFYLIELDRKQKLSLDSLKAIYNGLDLPIQSSRFGRWVKGAIRSHGNTTIGSLASDFTAIDINNQKITLSQFKGKNVVLLEFWASWCVPCRKGIPHLKTVYEKYHSHGLEIIGIAWMDRNRESWISAINQDSINMWYHVATSFRTGETINEELVFDFPFGPIPRRILIDKEGRVVGHWVSYSEETENALENKLADIFSN